MSTATISPKYQVVIPKDVRNALGLKPGTKVRVVPYKGRIELVPIKSLKRMRGFLAGIDTNVPREKDRV